MRSRGKFTSGGDVSLSNKKKMKSKVLHVSWKIEIIVDSRQAKTGFD